MQRIPTVKKQSGKIVLPAIVGNGTPVKAVLPLKDTIYYQVGAAGDYVQEIN